MSLTARVCPICSNIEASQYQLDLALRRIPAGPVIVYGVGSHTARLLAHMERISGREVQGIVDSNPNLEGERMGHWKERAPSSIQETPDGCSSASVIVPFKRSHRCAFAQVRA